MSFLLCTVFFIALVLVIFKVYMKLTTGWCKSQVCLVGKTAIVTGANTGIGYETAIDFAKRGARVILACRNEERARAACKKIIEETDNNNVTYKLVDLTSLKSVRKFAEEINKSEERLDILVNNAGMLANGSKYTEDGLQLVMQANYFGPFLLTNLLLDLLKKSAPSRIVNVSSAAGRRNVTVELEKLNDFPGNFDLYSLTKLCNIFFTIELASKLRGTEVTTYSLHPGAIFTDIFRDLSPTLKFIISLVFKHIMKNQTEGAQTTIYASVQKGIEIHSGEHFHDCKLVKRYKTAEDPGMPKKLWEKTEKIVKLI